MIWLDAVMSLAHVQMALRKLEFTSSAGAGTSCPPLCLRAYLCLARAQIVHLVPQFLRVHASSFPVASRKPRSLVGIICTWLLHPFALISGEISGPWEEGME